MDLLLCGNWAAVNKELFSLDVAEQKLRQTVDHGITGFWYTRQ